jgi:catechol 2,3-dioxygenase-like lactoylglutathione lyase family enzyme
MPRRFDHVDLRVPRLAEVASFYEAMLPALGFSRRVNVEGWLQFEGAGEGVTEFFGVTESTDFRPNENRIAFWAEDVTTVNQLAEIVTQAGAGNIEGPMLYEAGYYAVFFEDPAGNRFEVCFRQQNGPPS